MSDKKHRRDLIDAAERAGKMRLANARMLGKQAAIAAAMSRARDVLVDQGEELEQFADDLTRMEDLFTKVFEQM